MKAIIKNTETDQLIRVEKQLYSFSSEWTDADGHSYGHITAPYEMVEQYDSPAVSGESEAETIAYGIEFSRHDYDVLRAALIARGDTHLATFDEYIQELLHTLTLQDGNIEDAIFVANDSWSSMCRSYFERYGEDAFDELNFLDSY